MSNNKHRVNLTLDDDLFNLLGELADLQGKYRATVVKDYLEAMRPHMEGFVVALKLVEEHKDPSQHLLNMLKTAEGDFEKALNEVIDD